MINSKTNNIWFTPTSYGLVISQVDSERNLKRIYLDSEAADALINGPSEEVKKSLEVKGVNLPTIGSSFRKISQDMTECNELVSKHNWYLFSLYPLQISVQIVNYCNARCDFCYANAPLTMNKKIFEPEKIFLLRDYAAQNGVKFGISGGEPLLHPQIYDILSYKNREVFDTLITNLTPNFDFDRLIETKLDLIQVSVHGHGKYHDSITGIKGAYEKIMGRITELMDHVNMATNTVITPGNINAIAELVRDLKGIQDNVDKKLSYIRFVPVLPSGTGYNLYDTKTNFMDEVKTLLIKLRGEYPDMEFEVPMLHSNPYEYFYKDNRWVCPAGSTVAVVRIDGRVIPCNQFLDTNVCSSTTIDQRSFHDIWLSDSILSKMRSGIQGASTNISCEECRYLIMKEENQLFM
jgi:radical SAM protein with 4Fe4S-binding SPASM domain